jgi:cation:H+ antiporter
MAAWFIFALSGVAVVLAGIRLTQSGEVIAEETGLGGAWVGAVFIAIATSLPELATDFSAVRQGEHDLAIGDLFGSSMANMLILALLDLFLWRQRVLTRRPSPVPPPVSPPSWASPLA